MDIIQDAINNFIRQQREYTERTLAEVIEHYDFIVTSTACKCMLREILPEGARIAYSPYIEDSDVIYAIKKFNIRDLLESEGKTKDETYN